MCHMPLAAACGRALVEDQFALMAFVGPGIGRSSAIERQHMQGCPGFPERLQHRLVVQIAELRSAEPDEHDVRERQFLRVIGRVKRILGEILFQESIFDRTFSLLQKSDLIFVRIKTDDRISFFSGTDRER